MINRDIPPARAKGIYAGMNPEFGNDIPGAIAANSRVTYPGLAAMDSTGKDAWMYGPARIMGLSGTASPTLMDPGSNLDAVNLNASLAQRAGIAGNFATGDPQGTGFMTSGF
jgi:hypothetical protein